jgi:hypothetical protein
MRVVLTALGASVLHSTLRALAVNQNLNFDASADMRLLADLRLAERVENVSTTGGMSN